MTKPITIYVRKQPVIIRTTPEGEILVHETETHERKHLAKVLTKLLNTIIKVKDVTIDNIDGKVIYNDGCRILNFNLGYIQK